MRPSPPASLATVLPRVLQCDPFLSPSHDFKRVQEEEAQRQPQRGVDEEVHGVPGTLVVEIGVGAGVG